MGVCTEIDIPEKAEYSYVNWSHAVPNLVRRFRNKRQLKKLWYDEHRAVFMKYLMMIDRDDVLWEVFDIQWAENKILLFMDRLFTGNGIRMTLFQSLYPGIFKEIVDYAKDHISLSPGDWKSCISSDDWELHFGENHDGSKPYRNMEN